MRKGILKIGGKICLGGLELLAVVAVVILLVAGGVVWRVSSGPFDVSFARNYIRDALHDSSTDTDVTMDGVLLTWPVIGGPLELRLNNVSLQQRGRQVVSIQHVTLGLSTAHLILGRIEPINIQLDKPVLGMIRTADNHFQISLHQEAAPAAPGAQAANPLMDILAAMTAPKSSGPRSPLADLKAVKITDATLALEDHYANQTWYVQHVNFEFGRDRQGLAISAGFALPGTYQTGKGPAASSVLLDAVYGRELGDIKFNLHLENVDLSMAAGKVEHLDFLYGQKVVVTGDLAGRLDKAMDLQSLSLQLASNAGEITINHMYDDPLPYQNLLLRIVYDGVTKTAAVKQFALTAKGVTLNGDVGMALADDHAQAIVHMNIPQLAQAQIGPLWPDSLHEEGAYKWLVEKLSVGAARNVTAQLEMQATREPPPADAPPDTPPQWNVSVNNTAGAFDIENMTVDYRHPLTPLKGAFGHGVFKDGNLDIDVAKGTIGDMAATGHVRLTNIIHAHEGNALITVNATGPMKTLFRYIQDEPINLSQQQLGFKADEAKGTAKLAVEVAFPTIKDLLADQVKVKVKGTLNDITLPDIVEGMALTGGPFELEVADASAHLSGSGQLDGHDIKASLEQYLHLEGHPYSSRIEASLVADEALRKRFNVDIADWVGGAFPVNVTYTVHAEHHATVDLKADMTPATIMVAPVGYTKAPGVAGEMTCSIALVAGKVQQINNLHVKTPEMLLDNGTLFFGPREGKNNLNRGAFPVAKLGETDLALGFTLGENRQITVDGKGAFFDASYILSNKNKVVPNPQNQGSPPLIATINVAAMRTGPERTIENVNLLFDRAGNGAGYNRIKLTATAGRGAMDFDLHPDTDGKMSLRLAADDAGSMLRAFDIYKNAAGGKLLVQGRAPDAGNKTVIKGHGELNDFKVVKAPVLARLLNAINLIGIPELLGGEGINFSRLEGDFEWDIRPEGDRYTVKDGRTSGASIGLTFAGSVDKSTHQTSIAGTIIPVSGLNGLVGQIPVLGTLLTGGGALIAFTYAVEGPSDNPDISVNPLSALAPGIFREVFFKTK